MLNVVDEVTDSDNLHNHVLSLQQSLDKLLKYQLIMADQIEKLTNYNVKTIVKEVLKEINHTEAGQIQSFDDLIALNAKLLLKKTVKIK